MAALVGIIMGSTSDWETMRFASEKLEQLGIPFEVDVVSAHRTPDKLFEYAETAESKVFHAGTTLNAEQQLVSNGGRVLCAVALGDDVQQAQQAAYDLVNKIDWPGSYFRTDIGFKAIK